MLVDIAGGAFTKVGVDDDLRELYILLQTLEPVKYHAGSIDHQIALVFRLALTIK